MLPTLWWTWVRLLSGRRLPVPINFINTSAKMLEYYVILGIFVACGAQGSTTPDFSWYDCPVNATTGLCIDGNFPNPADCGSFVSCSNCLPYLQPCPAGLHYDYRVDQCVQPQDANCRTSVPPIYSTPTPTPGPTTVTPPKYEGAGFCVARDGDLEGAASTVPFPRVLAQVGAGYDRYKHQFTARDAPYFISLSVGAKRNTPVGFYMRQTGTSAFSVVRESSRHNGPDTLSRDLIGQSAEGDIFSVTSTSAIYSDKELQTSWTMFDLTPVSGSVHFSVARTSGMEAENPSEFIPFDTVLINSGGGWDSAYNEFIAPRQGLYFFSISAGVATGKPVNFNLRKDGVKYVDLVRTAFNGNGVDTMGRSIMAYLQQGESVGITMDLDTAVYSDAGLQTSFSGFLYEPLVGARVAWSVARTTLWESDIDSLFPVPFDTILVNEGYGYDVARHRARATVAGLYLVHISAGAQSEKVVNFSLLKNNQEMICDVFRGSTAHNGFDTLGRSVLLELAAGEELAVSVARGTAIYSDTQKQTSFSGVLVIPRI